jgi:hypothetical protein
MFIIINMDVILLLLYKNKEEEALVKKITSDPYSTCIAVSFGICHHSWESAVFLSAVLSASLGHAHAVCSWTSYAAEALAGSEERTFA